MARTSGTLLDELGVLLVEAKLKHQRLRMAIRRERRRVAVLERVDPPEGETRNALLKLRVTESEKRRVEAHAAAQGLEVSEYVRQRILADRSHPRGLEQPNADHGL